MPESIMLDPSLLLSFKTQPLLIEARRQGELEGMVLPASFVGAMADKGERLARAAAYFGKHRELPDLLPAVRKFVGDFPIYKSNRPALPMEPEEPPMLIKEWQALPLHREPIALRGMEPFEKRLRRSVRDQLVYEVLSEEWEFLQSHSWIVSKTRKPFSAFVKAGAVAIEWSKEHFDKAAAKTLKLKPEEFHHHLGPVNDCMLRQSG